MTEDDRTELAQRIARLRAIAAETDDPAARDMYLNWIADLSRACADISGREAPAAPKEARDAAGGFSKSDL